MSLPLDLAIFINSIFVINYDDESADKEPDSTQLEKIIRLIASEYRNIAESGNNIKGIITEKASEAYESLQKLLHSSLITTRSYIKEKLLKFSIFQSNRELIDAIPTTGSMNLNHINNEYRISAFYAFYIIRNNGENNNFNGQCFTFSGLFSSYRNRLMFIKDRFYSYDYYMRFYPYIFIIEKYIDYITTLKLHVPKKGYVYFRAFVVSSVWFEDAMRSIHTASIVLTYTNVFPSDCRMFIQIPIYSSGYIHRKDQLNMI